MLRPVFNKKVNVVKTSDLNPYLYPIKGTPYSQVPLIQKKGSTEEKQLNGELKHRFLQIRCGELSSLLLSKSYFCKSIVQATTSIASIKGPRSLHGRSFVSETCASLVENILVETS